MPSLDGKRALRRRVQATTKTGNLRAQKFAIDVNFNQRRVVQSNPIAVKWIDAISFFIFIVSTHARRVNLDGHVKSAALHNNKQAIDWSPKKKKQKAVEKSPFTCPTWFAIKIKTKKKRKTAIKTAKDTTSAGAVKEKVRRCPISHTTYVIWFQCGPATLRTFPHASGMRKNSVLRVSQFIAPDGWTMNFPSTHGTSHRQ